MARNDDYKCPPQCVCRPPHLDTPSNHVHDDVSHYPKRTRRRSRGSSRGILRKVCFLKIILFILFTDDVYRYKYLRQRQYRCPDTQKRLKRRYIPSFGRLGKFFIIFTILRSTPFIHSQPHPLSPSIEPSITIIVVGCSGSGLCETRRVVKKNPKGCNAINLMKRVVFRDCGIYHFCSVK
jgi:hypothetical protein